MGWGWTLTLGTVALIQLVCTPSMHDKGDTYFVAKLFKSPFLFFFGGGGGGGFLAIS